MYLDVTETDPNRNRRNGLVIFVICVILLGTLVKCHSQTCYTRSNPYAENPNITRILSCDGIGYDVNNKSVFVSIFADSINVHDYTVSIYVVFDKNKLKSPNLFIKFEDGELQECKPYYFDEKTGYAEFNMKEVNFMKLRSHKIDYIDFVNDDISHPVYEDKMALFYDFMRGL